MRTGLALYGGTFDPIHRGHLAAAEAALEQLPVVSVRFLVAGSPPHKNPRDDSDSIEIPSASENRLAMVRVAVEGLDGFEVDDREIRRPGPSYTVLTLRELQDEQSNRPLFFMIGSDNWSRIGEWHEAEEIFSRCQIVIMPRPGFRLESSSSSPFGGRAPILLSAPEHDVSSRQIRHCVRAGESIEPFVTEPVARFIADHGLYRRKRGG